MGFWYQNAQLGPYIPCNGPAAPPADVRHRRQHDQQQRDALDALQPDAVDRGLHVQERRRWSDPRRALLERDPRRTKAAGDDVHRRKRHGRSATRAAVASTTARATSSLSGTFAVKNAKMCAVRDQRLTALNLTGCWDPESDALVIVAERRWRRRPGQGNIVGLATASSSRASSSRARYREQEHRPPRPPRSTGPDDQRLSGGLHRSQTKATSFPAILLRAFPRQPRRPAEPILLEPASSRAADDE